MCNCKLLAILLCYSENYYLLLQSDFERVYTQQQIKNMGRLTVKRTDSKGTSFSNDRSVMVTPKGNKLYMFSDISVEERNCLRVNVYPYLI